MQELSPFIMFVGFDALILGLKVLAAGSDPEHSIRVADVRGAHGAQELGREAGGEPEIEDPVALLDDLPGQGLRSRSRWGLDLSATLGEAIGPEERTPIGRSTDAVGIVTLRQGGGHVARTSPP